jgi:transposase InsO family protein
VIELLADLFITRGTPEHIRSNQGSEFVPKAVRVGSRQSELRQLTDERGSPWENGYMTWNRVHQRSHLTIVADGEQLA